jgi:uncharacterized alpha-E superfamily protein
LTIYQRRYRSFIQLPLVLELLLLDETHPRSVAYQLQQLSIHLDALPRGKGKSHLSEEERLILKAYTDLRLCNGRLARVNEMKVFILSWSSAVAYADLLWRIAEVIAQTYFSHSEPLVMQCLRGTVKCITHTTFYH